MSSLRIEDVNGKIIFPNSFAGIDLTNVLISTNQTTSYSVTVVEDCIGYFHDHNGASGYEACNVYIDGVKLVTLYTYSSTNYMPFKKGTIIRIENIRNTNHQITAWGLKY